MKRGRPATELKKSNQTRLRASNFSYSFLQCALKQSNRSRCKIWIVQTDIIYIYIYIHIYIYVYFIYIYIYMNAVFDHSLLLQNNRTPKDFLQLPFFKSSFCWHRKDKYHQRSPCLLKNITSGKHTSISRLVINFPGTILCITQFVCVSGSTY